MSAQSPAIEEMWVGYKHDGWMEGWMDGCDSDDSGGGSGDGGGCGSHMALMV